MGKRRSTARRARPEVEQTLRGGVTRLRIHSREEDVSVEELLRLLREGKPAGALLVSILGPSMTRYARTRATDLSDADLEAASELAIEKAAARVHLFDPSRGTFEAWVRGFVRNEVRNLRRASRSILQFLEEAFRLPDADELDIFDQPAAREGADRVATSLAGLRPGDVEILMLRRGQRLAYSKVARSLRISEPAARQRYLRALRRLRELAAATDGPSGMVNTNGNVLEA